MKFLWVLAVTIALAAPMLAGADSSTAATAPQSLKIEAKSAQAQGNMAAQLQAESGKKPSKKTGKSQSPPPPK